MNDFPCTCGHAFGEHAVMSGICLDSVLWDQTRTCPCNQYIPDNLKYLENLSDTSR
jgi:hypothetical protein